MGVGKELHDRTAMGASDNRVSKDDHCIHQTGFICVGSSSKLLPKVSRQ